MPRTLDYLYIVKLLFMGPSLGDTFLVSYSLLLSPRKAEDCKDDVLKDGSEARRLALSLKGVAYGDQLVDELFTHSQKMEKLYEIVSGLLAKGDTSDGKYVKFVAAYQEKAAWFEKAKAGFYGQTQVS